ncbi:MAG: hypothetical protein EBY09_12415, partial [Verrucomicrobia bacterium]|nr:hypothetical protein [Verrucomicrobiota bacterium]
LTYNLTSPGGVGAALPGTHFTLPVSTLVFVDSESTTNLVVGIIDDSATNTNRVATLLLSDQGSTNTSSTTLTILDNDANPNFSLASYTVSEGGGSATITVNRLGGSADAYTVQYATANNTAVAGVNYTAASGTLSWADGEVAAKTFTVPVIHSLLTNGNLRVSLSLLNATNSTLGSAVAMSGQTNATLTIVDIESAPGQIGFLSPAFSVMENSNTVSITVVRTNGSSGAMSVNYTTLDGSATNLLHYTNAAGTFTWANGDNSSRTFLVGIRDNFATNLNRTVNLRLSNFVGGATPGITNAVLTIMDNDSVVGFSATNYTVMENDTNAFITILRSGATTLPVLVNFTTTAGTAASGDFTNASTSILFGPGVNSTNVSIGITDNFNVDGDRTVMLGLNVAVTNSATNAVVFDTNALPTVAVLTIVDNDTQLNFSAASYSIAENATNLLVTVVRSGVTNTLVTVDFATTNNTAVAGLHYLGTNGTLTFTNGVTTQTFLVPIIDNTVLNLAARTFNVLLSNVTGPLVGSSDTRLGTVTNALVTIVDNETVNPVAGSIDAGLTSLFSGGPVFALGIGTNTASPTTVGKLVVGGDFTNFNGTAQNRIVRLSLDGTKDATFNVGAGMPGTVRTLVVAADGSVYVGGALNLFGGQFGGNVAHLDATGAADLNFNLGNQTTDGSVLALGLQADGKLLVGGQFTKLMGVPQPFVGRLNTDGTLDNTFNVGGGPDAPVRALLVLPDGTVFIAGDFTTVNGVASPRLARLTTNGTVDATFATQLNGGLDGPVFDLALQGGNNIVVAGQFTKAGNLSHLNLARVGTNGTVDPTFTTSVNDYVNKVAVQPDGKVILGGGFTAVNGLARSRVARLNVGGSVDANINFGFGADADVEAVLVQPDDLRIVLGGQFQNFNGVPRAGLVRLNGRDSTDNGTLAYSTANYSVAESGGTVTITVVRSGGLNGVLTATSATADGTATSGVHYVGVTSPLTFADGQASTSFTVPITDSDSVTNVNRTFQLNLTATGGVLGTPATATVTIVDNDALPNFAVANYNVSELGGSAT